MPRTRKCTWWTGVNRFPCVLPYGHAGPHDIETQEEREKRERYHKAENTANYEVHWYLQSMDLDAVCQAYPPDVRPDIRIAIEGVIESVKRSSLGDTFDIEKTYEIVPLGGAGFADEDGEG